MKRTLAAAAAATAVLLVAGSAAADSTPVGPLPPGPVTTVTTERGQYVAVSLARQPARTGLVWRVARKLDTRVIRQVSEADVGKTVVVVFRAVSKGKATIAFAATKGDGSAKAVKSATYRVTVS
jgi:hypothetical protein